MSWLDLAASDAFQSRVIFRCSIPKDSSKEDEKPVSFANQFSMRWSLIHCLGINSGVLWEMKVVNTARITAAVFLSWQLTFLRRNGFAFLISGMRIKIALQLLTYQLKPISASDEWDISQGAKLGTISLIETPWVSKGSWMINHFLLQQTLRKRTHRIKMSVNHNCVSSLDYSIVTLDLASSS